MSKVTGICFIKMDAKLQRSKAGAKLEMGGMERTAVMANAGVAGYAEKPVPAKVTLTIIHDADTDVAALNGFVDGVVMFESDTGKSYMVGRAFTSKPCELTEGEGELSLEIMGDAAVEA